MGEDCASVLALASGEAAERFSLLGLVSLPQEFLK